MTARPGSAVGTPTGFSPPTSRPPLLTSPRSRTSCWLWLTPRAESQRLRGGAEGALDRADAATRLLLSEDFSRKLNAALIWAHARAIPGVHLAVGLLGFAVAGGMTGSGTLVAAVDLIEQKLVDFAGAADEVWIDLLIGTASIHQHARREFEDARVGSTALIAGARCRRR